MKTLKIKTIQLYILSFGFAVLTLQACNKNKPKEKSIVEQMVEKSKARELERKKEKDTPKEINFGKSKITYTSLYPFVKSENRSQQIKAVNPLILEAAFYDQNRANLKGNISLTYTSNSVKPDLKNGIEGLINGYKKMPGVEIAEVTKKDVTNQYGYPAIMATGKFKLSKNGETFDGNFYNLSIVKENEVLNFQAFTNFPETAKEVQDIYQSISLK